MTPLHVMLAVLVAVIWGFAFVATRIGLDTFSPSQLTALRFLIASAPAVFLARPPVPWSVLVTIGLTLFAGQFLFQFFGMAHGMPPGLASVVAQTQAFFTVLFAGLALQEKPTRRQLTGMTVAGAGLVSIAATVGQDLTIAGFLLTLMSAVSWAIGNVLVKRLPAVEMLELMVWLSVVPPLPSLALSLALDGPAALARMPGRGWLGWGAATYLGVIATVLAYAIWGNLLRRYPATMVTPFALLVPFVAAYASSVVFGEQFGALRLAGMASVLLGLAIIVLPVGPRLRHLATNAAENASIVPATRADTEGVIALIGRVYAEYGFIYDPPTEVPDLLRFEAHYEPPRGAFFVVRHGNEVVGSVGVERVDRDTAELHRLYLDADLRGGGTGRALVEAAVGWCRAQSVSRLFLWSDTRFERAHRLYARMGFRQRGERTLRDVNRTREYCFERKL